MASYEELTDREGRIREALTRGAEAQLRAIPGVLHVSVGLKERGGRVTDEHAIRVYVREKRTADRVAPAELIPAEIDGVPTDVNVVGAFGFAMDSARYRPLLGGIQITNRIIDATDDMSGTQMHRGTLGCFATLTSDRSPVLLSNWHVLSANSGRPGDRVYQPAPATIPPVSLADLPLRPQDSEDAIGRIVQTVVDTSVDCGIARLDVSSWCRCCGLDFHDEINGLSVGGHPPSNGIVGQRAAVAGMSVFKVGMQTGRTAGQVVDAHMPSFTITAHGSSYTFDGQIQISGDGTVPFSRRGDSGSVIIDQDGYVVGLLFGSSGDAPPGDRTVANHIEDVCTALGITIDFASPAHTAGARIAVPSAVAVEPGVWRDAYRAERDRLLADPAGRWLYGLADLHRAEMVQLVRGRRPVTVAWHRAHGPAFLAAALNELRSGRDALPLATEGMPLEDALERMRTVLAAHGSPALRDDLEMYGADLMEALRGSTTLAQVLARLNAAGCGATSEGGAVPAAAVDAAPAEELVVTGSDCA